MATVPPYQLSPTAPIWSRQAERRAPDQQKRNGSPVPGSGSSPFRFQSGLAGPAVEGEMGKNQAYKAMQRGRVGSSSGAPGAADAPEDGMVGPLPLP